MQGKSELAETIQKICDYATQAQQEVFERDKPAYAQYTETFSALLNQYIPNGDARHQAIIEEIVNSVFHVYTEIDGNPEKLAAYLKDLMLQLENDPNELQHWSIQSVIDTFVDAPDKEATQSIDEYQKSIETELDEALNLYHQKSEINQEIQVENGDLSDDEDTDLLDEEMSKLFHLSFADMEAESTAYDLNRFAYVAQEKPDTKSETSDNVTTVASESEDNLSEREHSLPETRLPSEDVSDTEDNEENMIFLTDFSEKLGAIIRDFQETFANETMPTADHKTLKTVVTRVANQLVTLHQACFVTTVTAENLNAFDSAAQKMIHHWDYQEEANVSYRSKALVTQAFSKLLLQLLKFTAEARNNLSPPTSQATHKFTS